MASLVKNPMETFQAAAEQGDLDFLKGAKALGFGALTQVTKDGRSWAAYAARHDASSDFALDLFQDMIDMVAASTQPQMVMECTACIDNALSYNQWETLRRMDPLFERLSHQHRRFALRAIEPSFSNTTEDVNAFLQNLIPALSGAADTSTSLRLDVSVTLSHVVARLLHLKWSNEPLPGKRKPTTLTDVAQQMLHDTSTIGHEAMMRQGFFTLGHRPLSKTNVWSQNVRRIYAAMAPAWMAAMWHGMRVAEQNGNATSPSSRVILVGDDIARMTGMAEILKWNRENFEHGRSFVTLYDPALVDMNLGDFFPFLSQSWRKDPELTGATLNALDVMDDEFRRWERASLQATMPADRFHQHNQGGASPRPRL